MKRWTQKLRLRQIRKDKRLSRRRKGKPSKRIFDRVMGWVKFPVTISLFSKLDRRLTLRAIRNLREAVMKSNMGIILLDFTEVRYIIADAMLLIYAEVDRIISSGILKSSIRFKLPRFYPRDKEAINKLKIMQVLKHIGILDMVGQKSDIVPDRQDVIHWRVEKGEKSEGQKTETILEVVDRRLGGLISKKFYTGMTEAMTNSYHHAYGEDRMDGLSINIGGWWMFLQHLENKLSILICDLGMGIPRSLPKTHKTFIIDMLEGLMNFDDRSCINYAVQSGNTSTALANRGKGLKKMVDIVDDIPDSSLIIYSNKGVYVKNVKIRTMLADYEDSIMGTLISWTVEFPKIRGLA